MTMTMAVYQDDENDDMPLVECPECESNQEECVARLGVLGRTTHYRCRFCGWQWAETPHQ